MQQLLGLREGLVRFDEKANAVKVVADGAQFLEFSMSLEIDSLWGLVVVIKGKEFIEGGDQVKPIDQRLLRIQGGWLDLNSDCKK